MVSTAPTGPTKDPATPAARRLPRKRRIVRLRKETDKTERTTLSSQIEEHGHTTYMVGGVERIGDEFDGKANKTQFRVY